MNCISEFMYAKIFAQIFDSSIAENYETRHTFEDLLKLADLDGVVDMTMEAISRRTNVPIEKVRVGIEELSKPDPKSRCREKEGRRIVLVDSNRDWGWVIVNYAHYRNLQDEETRRGYFRDAKRRERSRKKPKKMQPPNGRETRFEDAVNSGNESEADRIAAEGLPSSL